MSPLYRNDAPGEFPDSWYAASTTVPPQRPALRGEERADVAIVGAGFTGLTAALRLAQAGRRVIVLEAHRAGFGASGRNGGQVSSGYNWGQRDLARRLGDDAARLLWEASEQAKQDLRENVTAHAPDARYTPGVAYGVYSDGARAKVHAEAEYLRRTYGYETETLDRRAFHDIVNARLYTGGVLDMGAGHVHPLRYVLGLARAAVAAGAVIHEASEVIRVIPGAPVRIETAKGHVLADHLILAGNGYLPGIVAEIAAKVMPINSFIGATEPLGDRADEVLRRDIAVADEKFVVNYFRLSEDRRLLFGGRESYTLGFPRDIETALRARMLSLFPQLDGVRMDHVWGGTLGITMTRLPSIQRVSDNILSAAGYSGHGVALSGFAGRVMAEAVIGQTDRFDVLEQLPVPNFPGGTAFRAPLLALAMSWYGLRDRLGF